MYKIVKITRIWLVSYIFIHCYRISNLFSASDSFFTVCFLARIFQDCSGASNFHTSGISYWPNIRQKNMKFLWSPSSQTLKNIGGGHIAQEHFSWLKNKKYVEKGDLDYALFCGILPGNIYFFCHFPVCQYVTHYMKWKKYTIVCEPLLWRTTLSLANRLPVRWDSKFEIKFVYVHYK